MILDDNHVLRRQYHVIIHQFGMSREPKTTTQLHSGPWIWSRTSHGSTHYGFTHVTRDAREDAPATETALTAGTWYPSHPHRSWRERLSQPLPAPSGPLEVVPASGARPVRWYLRAAQAPGLARRPCALRQAPAFTHMPVHAARRRHVCGHAVCGVCAVTCEGGSVDHERQQTGCDGGL